jgi:hypothetical protein
MKMEDKGKILICPKFNYKAWTEEGEKEKLVNC